MLTRLLLSSALCLAACNSVPLPPLPEAREVRIDITTPDQTEQVYLTGSLERLGPWRPDALAMESPGPGQHTATVTVPAGETLEYKFTLGIWDREAVGPTGIALRNFRLADGAVSARHDLAGFKKDVREYIASPDEAGILGQLDYWLNVPSQNLSETRHVTIWTPPRYAQETAKRYRVIYMSDGQNLFDPRIANTGVDWGVDEAMVQVAAATGTDPAIVVATWSTTARGSEYSPWHDAPAYAEFLEHELMPRVNAEYRTLTGPENTFHAGSSMGGLLSYYLVTDHPDLFGACGCLSTHFLFSEAMASQSFMHIENVSGLETEPYILMDISSGKIPSKASRYWFDYGTRGLDAGYEPTQLVVREWMVTNGKTDGADLVVREYDGADHNETSWRQRLPDVLTFLLVKESPE